MALKGAPQLVAAHWAQILPFEPNLRPVFLREIDVVLKRRRLQKRAHPGGGGMGGVGEVGHPPDVPGRGGADKPLPRFAKAIRRP